MFVWGGGATDRGAYGGVRAPAGTSSIANARFRVLLRAMAMRQNWSSDPWSNSSATSNVPLVLVVTRPLVLPGPAGLAGPRYKEVTLPGSNPAPVSVTISLRDSRMAAIFSLVEAGRSPRRRTSFQPASLSRHCCSVVGMRIAAEAVGVRGGVPGIDVGDGLESSGVRSAVGALACAGSVGIVGTRIGASPQPNANAVESEISKPAPRRVAISGIVAVVR